MKLHLGCYNVKIHGFINVDIREEGVNPDIVDDCAKLEKFEKNSIELIYSAHMLEHFNKHEYKNVLNRWFEVLKPKGILRIAVPDLQAICEWYICYKDIELLQTSFFGSQKHPFDFHYMGFDEKFLTKVLQEVGFENIHRYDWRKTDHAFIDDHSQCYLPVIAYNTRRPEGHVEGKLISLNMEATKPEQ